MSDWGATEERLMSNWWATDEQLISDSLMAIYWWLGGLGDVRTDVQTYGRTDPQTDNAGCWVAIATEKLYLSIFLVLIFFIKSNECHYCPHNDVQVFPYNLLFNAKVCNSKIILYLFLLEGKSTLWQEYFDITNFIWAEQQ